MNIDVDVNPSYVIGITLRKFIEYKNVNIAKEELNDFTKMLLKDEELKKAITEMVKFERK